MKPKTVKFIFVGETKNKFRYDEEKIDGTEAVVGALYVSKNATKADDSATPEPPKELIVVITPVTA